MMEVFPIGYVRRDQEGGTWLEIDEAWRPALRGLDGYSHLNLIFWFDGSDNPKDRSKTEAHQPYYAAPESNGTFATRSPRRPNPIGLTVAEIRSVDPEAGRVDVGPVDARDGTPILDIKPYIGHLDRVEVSREPDWCADWPKSFEADQVYDWSQVKKNFS